MRILIVSDGDPNDASTNSGVARGVLRAFSHRPDTEVVGAVSSAITGPKRLLLALLTLRPTRRWWWATFNLGLLNMRGRSIQRDRAAQKLHDLDFILQVRNIYYPSSHPYIVFIDSTSAMANSGWTAWRPSPALRALRHSIELRQFRGAEFIFTAGHQAAASVIGDYGIPSKKVTAVGGGINFETLPDPESLTEYRQFRAPEILFVGIDFERKGGDLLLAAHALLLEKYPHLRLTLVGATPPVQQVHENVRILGKIVDRDEMAAAYRGASIFCLPARHEPYGLVLQEAMAYLLPCVASDVGAISSIVENGVTGYVVEPENVTALASALDKLIGQPELSSQFGNAGRRKAESDLTWDAVASRMVDVISRRDN
jgi:glycosyltransferase involved in cell wall biosynthesis